MSKIKEKIESLREELNFHTHLYYVENRPQISDYDFDMLLKNLQKLEEEHPEFNDPNSPTKRVGGEVTKSFTTVQHDTPMQSLGNSYSEDEIEEFITRIQKELESDETEFVCELKYDGVAIAVKYQNGNFAQAITRGNGLQGDDVSNNVTISNKSGFYTAKIDKIENLNINEKTNGIAIIKTDEISFFQRIIKPLKMLKTE